MKSIVIPYIKTKNDTDLRFCLRSIEKYMPGEVFIIGYRPDWLTNVTHIPYQDGHKKQENIRGKILAACGDERVSDPFCFTNDDIYILSPIIDLPYYYDGCLSKEPEKGAKPLCEALRTKGYETKNFDFHAPIIYEKEKFKEAMSHFGGSYVIKSAYCNYHRIEGVEIRDLKINSHLSYSRIMQEIQGRPVFSTGNYGMSEPMIKVLSDLFPYPSKYEDTAFIGVEKSELFQSIKNL